MTRPLPSSCRAARSSSLRLVLVGVLLAAAIGCKGSKTSGAPGKSDAGSMQDASDYVIDAANPGPVIDSGPRSDGGYSGDASPPAVCGNGKFEAQEICDDGNTSDADGCSADCRAVDPDYLCLNAGEACTRVVTCGNGIIEGSEICDDGESTPKSGDGCSADCKQTEAGFDCFKPGQACVRSAVCGNGQRERGEQCDDGQATPASGDGCDTKCQLEDPAAWFCPPGSACIALVCGDGVRTPDEQCDDNGTQGGDGCDAMCKVEVGFRCGSSGCRPICGDGQLVTGEDCDDSNLASGDGCSAACKREPYFTCPSTAGACTSSIVCGDGCVEPGEICDPGGLSPRCSQADASCTSTSQDSAMACKSFQIASDPGVCGDGTLNLNEQCDPDCSGTPPCNIPGCMNCQITSGWACPRAGYCFQIPRCGDGIIQIGEECDPGPSSVAGCDATSCEIVSGYYCSGAPSMCVRSRCGDGFRAPNEQCDDGPGTQSAPGTAVGGDGCSASCTVEAGYVCPPNLSCKPICGDGVLQPGESCEETSAGCSNCVIQRGYDCNASGKSCARTVCGAANTGAPVVQRGEGCDDGNDVAGDGCGPTCQLEPAVTVGSSPVVHTRCGDGLVTSGEACDDGNASSGDGCSASCAVETGFTCTQKTDEPDSVQMKVTYRDFKGRNESGGHPHMRQKGTAPPNTGLDLGITGAVCNTQNGSTCGRLDMNGKPALAAGTHPTVNTGGTNYPEAFALWYRDANPSNLAGAHGVIATNVNPPTAPAEGDFLTLTREGSTASYSFDSASFYPLNGRGFSSTPGETNNYHFTTELRSFFQYRGGETLTFRGDDDVWVFINGRLAVDIGGIHGPEWGRVVLGDDGAASDDSSCTVSGGATTPAACSQSAAELADTTDTRFGLTKGDVYEIVLFNAERHPTGSNFRLTLTGFLAPRSTCATTCGDGIRAGNEICDTAGAPASGYNVCLANCTINFCGDGTRQSSNEACDSAVKVTYQQAAGGCGFDCRPAPYCGDGIVQAFAGEVCDDGNNSGAYGSCASNCRGFGGYCGDGMQNGPEQCDSASKVAYQANGQGCGFDCRWAPSCGDGTRNGPETCEPPNTAQCNSMCQVQPFCGDGIKSPNEACDYGTFNAAPASVGYSGCTTSCELGPRCGDSVRQQTEGEECDDGSNNSPANNPAYNSCTTVCLQGPRCGDGIRQQAEEACDNGFNEDTYAYGTDACGPNCTLVPRCGDGLVYSAVEQCDNGNANSDGAYNGCRSDCSWGPYCGDGVTNGGEQCDDPKGNVAYSADGKGCSLECKRNVPSCGDGVRNGPEKCDNGTANNTGAYGGCNENCTRAPYCGDGVVQRDREQCDAGPTGSSDCTQDCNYRIILL